ncbi:MAG: DNA ligase D [Chryseobacterium sp.]|nr:MAG: DNA ligase D [Chryseobacterium sp.]
MLAQTGDEAFSDPDWVFEIKWDGYRAIAEIGHEIKLYSRNGLSFLSKFRRVAEDLALQQHDMVVDGEIVVFDDDGKPNFQLLQQIADHTDAPIAFQVFDLLKLNGQNTEELTLLQRKELLRDALTETEIIRYCEHIPGDGEAFFSEIRKMNLEGMMAKHAGSLYAEGHRTADWLKIKLHESDEVIICGFTEPRGSRIGFGALILGRYDGNKLIYAGHTGTGFDTETLKDLYKRLEPMVIRRSPFDEKPKTNMPATWVRPELVCEIEYTEVTKDGIFRHPVFKGLRFDKEPYEITVKSSQPTKAKQKTKPSASMAKKDHLDSEIKVGEQKIALTNQDKVYWPENGYTKGDLIEYYQSMAEYILPHLKDRPQSLHRFPNGITGMSFYQKDAADQTPDWIPIKQIHSESNNKMINYILCNDRATMAYLNNLGCIDLNPWTAKADNLDHPDYMVIDLDPSENNTFDDVIETAQAVKELLDFCGAEGYCKTSGATGIHIYVPMGAKYNFEQVKDFAHLIVELVQRELPDITTLERSLKKRDPNRIYLDYLQNRPGQTLASAYSIRPRPGAPVSMPLEWKELKKGLRPTDFNIKNALKRVEKKGDLFLPVLEKGIDMLTCIEKLQDR